MTRLTSAAALDSEGDVEVRNPEDATNLEEFNRLIDNTGVDVELLRNKRKEVGGMERSEDLKPDGTPGSATLKRKVLHVDEIFKDMRTLSSKAGMPDTLGSPQAMRDLGLGESQPKGMQP